MSEDSLSPAFKFFLLEFLMCFSPLKCIYFSGSAEEEVVGSYDNSHVADLIDLTLKVLIS